MKLFKYLFLSFVLFMSVFSAYGQTTSVRLETPEILEGTVVNDSYYYGEISVGTTYTGDLPFMGWNREVYFSLDNGNTWEAADKKEWPSSFELDYSTNSFPGKSVRVNKMSVHILDANTLLKDSSKAVITIYIYVTSQYRSVDIVPLDDGNFVATWRHFDAQGNDTIYFQLFDTQGHKIGSEYLVCSQQEDLVVYPKSRVAALGNGSFIIAWENHVDPDDPRSNVLAAVYRYRNGDLSVRNSLELNTTGGRQNLAPLIVPVDRGFVALTRQWWIEDNHFRSGFFGRQYDIDGHAVGGLFNIPATNSVSTDISNAAPGIVTLANGERFFIWEERPAQLFMQRLNNGFSQVGSRIKVSDTNTNSWTASAFAQSQFFVAWDEQDSNNVRGQFFTNNGSPDGSSLLFNENSNTSIYSSNACPYMGDGMLFSWSQYGNGRYSARIRRYYPDKQFHEIEYVPDYEYISSYYFTGLADTDFISSWRESSNQRNFALFSGMKLIYSPPLSPEQDINIQCKIVDPETGEEWVSPVRSYLYADPDDGTGSTISYKDGYTNQDNARVAIDLTEGRYKSLDFYVQKAALENGQGGSFGEWAAYGSYSTLTREIDVALSDGYCYRFKYIITNMANISHEITGENILGCDMTPPEILVLEEKMDESILSLMLGYSDAAGGIADIHYRVNKRAPVAITGHDLAIILDEGPNHVVIQATDRAENRTVKHFFKTVDTVVPEIRLTGIRDHGEYGDTIVFRYSSTVPLTWIGLYVDDSLTEMLYSGEISLYLGAYEEGAHLLSVKGRDAKGTILEKSVTIYLKHGTFTLILLSPGEGEYGSPTIPVEFWSDKPLLDVWYRLDQGENQTGMILTDVRDGSHELTLYAVDELGNENSVSSFFTVQEVFPELDIINPVAGGVYPAKTIELVFDTNANVSYEFGGQTALAVSGDAITVSEDGEYELILIAAHPVSGNIIRESIPFTVDSVEPGLSIVCPESRLYAHNDINIEYTFNKPMDEIIMYLDNEPVNTLQNLLPGLHTFEIHARDKAGRTIEKRVDFTITRLEITSPAEGEKILSEDYPHIVPFSYDAERGFEAITQSLDDQAGRLITESPGTIIPLETGAGDHELHLRGYMDEFSVIRKTRFQIGRRNLLADKSSINYTYSRLGSSDEYNVNVMLTVRNNGDLDIEQPVAVRFDAISLEGKVDSFWNEIVSLPAHGSAIVRPGSFTARFGDRFLLTIDPEAEITGDEQGDNFHQIDFQTGQVTNVSATLPETNVYLSGVSVWNEMKADTAGSIACVEFHTNNKIFVDKTPDDGFQSIVDMGLLSPEENYIQVLAYGFNNVILDSRKYFYQIKSLPEQMGRYEFPWSYVASDGYADYDHVVMSDIDRKELLTLKNDLVLYALSHPSTILPYTGDDQKITYKIIALASEGTRSSRSLYNIDENLPLGDYVSVGGPKSLPNGKGYMAEITLDPVNGSCIFTSDVILFDSNGYNDYIEILEESWQNITGMLDEMLFTNMGLETFFYDNSIDLFSVKDPDSLKVYRSIENIKIISWQQTFTPGECFICNLLDSNDLEIQFNGMYQGTAVGAYLMTIGKQSSLGFNWDFVHPYLFSVSYSRNFYTYKIPIEVTFTTEALIQSVGDDAILNPVLSRLSQKQDEESKHPRVVYESSAGFSFLGGFSGASSETKAKFSLYTTLKAAVATATDMAHDLYPVTCVFSYGEADLTYKVTRKTKRCFFWVCRTRKKILKDIKQHVEGGEDYDDSDIADFLDDY